MNKQKDILPPRRLYTPDSPRTGIKVENAQVQAWKSWAHACEGSPGGVRRLWNLRLLDRWLPKLEIYV